MSRLFSVAALAWRTLLQHPLQTFLSTLGLVIGVASLVAILSLADGLESYARDQISSTTDLQSITVDVREFEQVDGVAVRRDSAIVFGESEVNALVTHLGPGVEGAMTQMRSVVIERDTLRTAARLTVAEHALWRTQAPEMAAGRAIAESDTAAVVVNAPLAERLGGMQEAIGQEIVVDGTEVEVVGAVEIADTPLAFGPWALASPEAGPPSLVLHVEQAEAVASTADRVRAWLDRETASGADGFSIATDQMRAEQLAQGMLIFKLVMGLITGISVVVGGVGVMNVLLMTVTERTQEIGIRKATGARRRDIVAQFLAEAVMVSSAGSAVGLLAGLAVVFTAVPILRSVADVPFHAGFSLGSLLVVSLVAIAVGLVFGTYPAWRAARLSPVDAIRRE